MTDPGTTAAATNLVAADCKVLFGSLQNYLWAEKGGLQIAVSEHSRFSYNQTEYRAIFRVDASVVLKAAWARLNKGALN